MLGLEIFLYEYLFIAFGHIGFHGVRGKPGRRFVGLFYEPQNLHHQLTSLQARKVFTSRTPRRALSKLDPKVAIELQLYGCGLPYQKEYRFHPERKFRFDFAIPDYKIAIEYEGIFSLKSRHTTVTGYSFDTEKYNLAIIGGWKVLRYTQLTYTNAGQDIEKLLKAV